MPLFQRRRGNRRVVEVLNKLEERRAVVVPAARTALKKVVQQAGLPKEVEAFVTPIVENDPMVGFVMIKFAADLPQADADDVIDNERPGRIVELIIGFIERGGLQLILEFILALVSVFSK